MELRAISGTLMSQRLWRELSVTSTTWMKKKFTILTSCDIVLIKLLSRVFKPLGNASEDASICFTLFYCILQRENELLNLFIKT